VALLSRKPRNWKWNALCVAYRSLALHRRIPRQRSGNFYRQVCRDLHHQQTGRILGKILGGRCERDIARGGDECCGHCCVSFDEQEKKHLCAAADTTRRPLVSSRQRIVRLVVAVQFRRNWVAICERVGAGANRRKYRFRLSRHPGRQSASGLGQASPVGIRACRCFHLASASLRFHRILVHSSLQTTASRKPRLWY